MQQNFITYILLCLFIYLYSAIPFALIIGKYHGVDIRKTGSGNIGGSNLGRACGPKAFILTFILDMSKGAISVWLANYFNFNPLAIIPFALLGHCFSIFIKFKGGKGIATCFGFALAYAFVPAIIAIVSFLIILKISKYVSLSAILAIYVYDIVMFLQHDYQMGIFVFILNLVVIYLHRSNIKRIINGTENKITWM